MKKDNQIFVNTNITVPTKRIVEQGIKTLDIRPVLEEGMRFCFNGRILNGDNKKEFVIDIKNVLANKNVAENLLVLEKSPNKAEMAVVLAASHFTQRRAAFPGYNDFLPATFEFSQFVDKQTGDCVEIALLAQTMLQSVGEISYVVSGHLHIPGKENDDTNHCFILQKKEEVFILRDSSAYVISQGKKFVFSYVLPEEMPVCREVSSNKLYAGGVYEDAPAFWLMEAEMKIGQETFRRYYNLDYPRGYAISE